MINDPCLSMTGVREGDVIDGKYQVLHVIGTGGMGTVIAARHLHLDEKVAIKFLNPDMRANTEVVARFAQEARTAVKIKSEHVARVFDVCIQPDGTPYIVMEYLEGSDLARFIAQHGALTVERAVEFALQACDALAEAHALGIVHRDIKPANLFCLRRTDGLLWIKVLDFGISKLVGPSRTDLAITRASSIVGSPYYMSPEQMTASTMVDARTDIWSLGVILYEMLTGRLPFEGDTLPEICAKMLRGEHPALRDRKPDAPLALQEIVEKCLETEPERRFRDVAELASALAQFAPKRLRNSVDRISRVVHASGVFDDLSGPPSSSDRRFSGAADTMAAVGQTASRQRRARRSAFGVTASLVVVSLAAAVAITYSRSKHQSAVDASAASRDAASADPPSARRQAPSVDVSPSVEVIPTATASAAAVTTPVPKHEVRTKPAVTQRSDSGRAKRSPAEPSAASRAPLVPVTTPTNKWGGRQ
jgi:eukaryotic-like serine/threonine-protein kinase